MQNRDIALVHMHVLTCLNLHPPHLYFRLLTHQLDEFHLISVTHSFLLIHSSSQTQMVVFLHLFLLHRFAVAFDSFSYTSPFVPQHHPIYSHVTSANICHYYFLLTEATTRTKKGLFLSWKSVSNWILRGGGSQWSCLPCIWYLCSLLNCAYISKEKYLSQTWAFQKVT